MIIIRKMRENDLIFFLELRNSCVEFLHNKKVFTMEECRHWFNKSIRYYIIELDGTPVGYVRTSNKTRRSIYIGADILPEYRRKGIASRALTTIMDMLQKPKYYLEVLETNTIAKKLYEKIGFKELSRKDGSILMEKEMLK